MKFSAVLEKIMANPSLKELQEVVKGLPSDILVKILKASRDPAEVRRILDLWDDPNVGIAPGELKFGPTEDASGGGAFRMIRDYAHPQPQTEIWRLYDRISELLGDVRATKSAVESLVKAEESRKEEEKKKEEEASKSESKREDKKDSEHPGNFGPEYGVAGKSEILDIAREIVSMIKGMEPKEFETKDKKEEKDTNQAHSAQEAEKANANHDAGGKFAQTSENGGKKEEEEKKEAEKSELLKALEEIKSLRREMAEIKAASNVPASMPPFGNPTPAIGAHSSPIPLEGLSKAAKDYDSGLISKAVFDQVSILSQLKEHVRTGKVAHQVLDSTLERTPEDVKQYLA